MLSQNTTQANTKATRADRHRPRGRLVFDTPVILRVNKNISLSNYTFSQESLTAMRMIAFTRENPLALYVVAHRLIALEAKGLLPYLFNPGFPGSL